MKNILVFCILMFSVILNLSSYAWDDHADVQDHKETDQLFKEAQKQTKAIEYEKDMLIAKEKEELKNFKSSKFKRKQNEDSNNYTALDIDDCP